MNRFTKDVEQNVKVVECYFACATRMEGRLEAGCLPCQNRITEEYSVLGPDVLTQDLNNLFLFFVHRVERQLEAGYSQCPRRVSG